jgi:hypothetical protein
LNNVTISSIPNLRKKICQSLELNIKEFFGPSNKVVANNINVAWRKYYDHIIKGGIVNKAFQNTPILGNQYIVGIFLWGNVALRGLVDESCLLMISRSEMGVFW